MELVTLKNGLLIEAQGPDEHGGEGVDLVVRSSNGEYVASVTLMLVDDDITAKLAFADLDAQDGGPYTEAYVLVSQSSRFKEGGFDKHFRTYED